MEIPEGLLRLMQLRALYLGLRKKVAAEKSYYLRNEEDKKACNAVTALPPILFTSLIHLQSLHLEHNQLTALPTEIGQLSALRELYLQNNQLMVLPAEFGQLAALQDLELGANRLMALTAEVGQLTALQRLGLRDNRLTSLPAEIGQLAGLRELYLDRNCLTSLPAEIGQLAGLQGLGLQGNRLTSLPAEIGQLARLQAADLRDNQLSSLPTEISLLAGLRGLYLDGNQLASLPAEIGQLAGLQGLDLRDNQLSPALEKAWKEGGIASLAALLQAQTEKTAQLFEAKLLVTGEGKVGKSWALAALHGDDPRLAVGDQTTYGVYCGDLRLPHPDAGQCDKTPAGTEIHLNTWDFGGQNVYRITHQFFFTQEAIFLLVWNPRSGAEQCRVREWLRMIELRTGGNAKVILVASHSPKDK